MLLKLRGGLDSFFVTILLGILIAAFAVWGIGPNMLGGNSKTVAMVGDTEVETQQYARAVQRRAQQLQQQFGSEISSERLITMLSLDRQVLSQMIADAAVSQHTTDMGLRATTDQVVDELHQLDAFILPDGRFSREMMERALRNAGITEKELLADMRRGVVRNQLLESMAAGAKPPRALAETLFVWQAERRRAAMINIAATDIKDIPAATEEDLVSFYEANKGTYMTPERRSFRYIVLTPDQFVDQVELGEGELEGAYQARLDEFAKPELRALNLVSFPERETAEAFIADVAAGKDFATAAAAATEFSADEIDIGDQTRADIVTDFDEATAQAIFSADSDAIVGPVEGLAGWNVFKITGITAGTTRSIDEVRDELAAELKHEHAVTKMFDFLPDLEDAVASQGALPAVAEQLKLTLATVTDIDSRGRNADGAQVITQQNENIVLADAFQTEAATEAEIKDLNPNDNTAGVFLLEVTNVAAPAERPLEDVKEAVRTAWELNRKQAKAGEIAEAAKTRLAAGEDAEKIATDLGGTSFEAKNVARTGDANSSLSANIRRLIFDLPIGAADAEKSADGNGYVVVRVEEIFPGDPAAQPAQVDALYGQLQEQYTGELLDQYQAYLKGRYETEINFAIIQRLFPRDTAQ